MRLVLVALALLVASLLPAAAEKRVALIIGNSAYKHASALANPKNDAADMTAALKAHGFTIISGSDLDKAGMDRTIRDFSAALAGADAALFFYAGHAPQVGGVNYLVPVDAQLTTAAALDFEMVRLDLVQRIMEREAKTNILFLDACRDNPLARNLARAMGTRSADIGRGLAAAESGVGTLISFSTQPGNVALDGTGRNSPFAAALVKNIQASTDAISDLLVSVRNDVMHATARKQVPWEHSALTGRFYFKAPAATPAQVPFPGGAVVSEAERHWENIKTSTSVGELEAFVRRYGDTFHGDLAKVRIEELKAKAASEPRKQEVAAPPTAPKKQEVAAAVPPPPPAKPSAATPAVQQQFKPGDTFKDCPECPEMVVVPAGSFTMGSSLSDMAALPEHATVDAGYWPDEGPRRTVTIRQPFAVGKYEVTFAEWDACVAAGGCAHKPEAEWGRGRQPVMRVLWEDAKQYAAWLSKETGQTYRLPSEAEWEYAARAGTNMLYSTGRTITMDQANFAVDWRSHRGRTVEVGSFKANDFGLYDMHGNVWEWVEDCWHDSYNGAPSDGSAWTTACSRSSRAYRGGSWNSYSHVLRIGFRGASSPDRALSDIGFRLARTLNPAP